MMTNTSRKRGLIRTSDGILSSAEKKSELKTQRRVLEKETSDHKINMEERSRAKAKLISLL